jgi:hypothetical protein
MEKTFLIKLPIENGYLTEYNQDSGFVAWNFDMKNARHFTFDQAIKVIWTLYSHDKDIKQVQLVDLDGLPVLSGKDKIGFTK